MPQIEEIFENVDDPLVEEDKQIAIIDSGENIDDVSMFGSKCNVNWYLSDNV